MTEPTNEEIADVLDKARDTLLVRGWYQGGFEDGSAGVGVGPVCAFGAINAVVNRDATTTSPESLRAEEALCDVVHVRAICQWNDDPSTTEDDVHDLLLNTAKALREDA